MNDLQNKLVSIVVISYNSEDTIAETLDSIYAQTYENIELVISDDASSDNTVEVSRKWIEEHKSRFTNCILIDNKKNQGAPGNLNTGIKSATGYYIKDFASDDILLPDYLEKHIAFLEENNCDCVFSNVKAFSKINGKKEYVSYPESAGPDFFDLSAQEQYKLLICANRLSSPTFLATRALYEKHGLYDLDFPAMEDYPYYVHITKNGTKLNYLDVCLVEYRVGQSLSNGINTRVINPNFQKSMKSFFYKKRFFPLLKYKKFKTLIAAIWEFFFADCIILFGNNRSLALVRFCEYMKNFKFLKRFK